MPQKTKDAPGELATLRAFVNTLDIEAGTDSLGTPDGLEEWMRAHGLLVTGEGLVVDEAEVRRVAGVREAFRELILANNDAHRPDPGAARALDAAAARARLRLTVTSDGGARLECDTGGVDGALGRLLIIAYRAMETGVWSRLKACRNDRCRWAFYDHSRNHSGHWCDMAVCGNRSKVKAYRTRRSGAAS
jgi:predicted RNA-binding Zn ribbon-like protein